MRNENSRYALPITNYKKPMHDLMAAQEILRKALEVAREKKLKKITKIVVELGTVIDHDEEITEENISFNLKNLAKGTLAEEAEVVVQKVSGNHYALTEMEGD